MVLVYFLRTMKNNWYCCVLFQSVLIAKCAMLVAIIGLTKGGNKKILSFVFYYIFKYFSKYVVFLNSSKRHQGNLNGNSVKYLFVFSSYAHTPARENLRFNFPLNLT